MTIELNYFLKFVQSMATGELRLIIERPKDTQLDVGLLEKVLFSNGATAGKSIDSETRVLDIPIENDLFSAIAELPGSFRKEQASAIIRAIVRPFLEIEDYKRQLEIYKRQLDETTELAFKDPLTLAFNRRAYDILGNNLVRDCLTYSVPLTLMVFDVDNFKGINDDKEKGHDCGDQVLRTLTDIIHECIRPIDSLYRLGNEEYIQKNGKKLTDDTVGGEAKLCRIGGDEFTIFFLGADAKKAFNVAARRVYERIIRHNFSYNNKTFRIGISGGLATLWGDCKGLDQLFRRADINLYKAKEQGKRAYYSDGIASNEKVLGLYRDL